MELPDIEGAGSERLDDRSDPLSPGDRPATACERLAPLGIGPQQLRELPPSPAPDEPPQASSAASAAPPRSPVIVSSSASAVSSFTSQPRRAPGRSASSRSSRSASAITA